MEDIVITGATGFLGRNLAQYFLDRGDRVWALVRPESPNSRYLPVHEKLKIVPVGMEHVTDSVPLIGRADAWFHFAWGGVNREEIDSPAVQARNISCSMDCVEAAHLLGCRVFMDAGSRVEYGIVRGMMEEGLECFPVNEYGKAKLAFFQKAAPVCRKYSMHYEHLRFFSVYGYGDHPWSVISTLIGRLRANEDVSLSACLHHWNFMYIEDAIRAVAMLYDFSKGSGEVVSAAVNVASRDTRVLKEFVEEIRTLIGGEGKLHYGTFVQAKEGALSIRPDLRRLEQLTGGFMEEYSFRNGILTTIEKEMDIET